MSRDGRKDIVKRDHPRADKRGRVRRYTLVAEEKIGRLVLPTEVVHHIDGNPSNDAPDNLQVMTRSAHVGLHSRERWRKKLVCMEGYTQVIKRPSFSYFEPTP